MHDNQKSQGMDMLELIKFKSVYYVDSIIFLDVIFGSSMFEC